MADETPRIDTEPDAERQVALTAAYEANIATGKAPYAEVQIATYGELQWVIQQRHWRQWSGNWGERPTGLEPADFRGTRFNQVNLSGADLSMANMSGAELNMVNLSGANLSSANLHSTTLYGANLSGANLLGADLSGADLGQAQIIGTDFRGANVSGANLSGADGGSARFNGANMSGVNLSKANMKSANFDKTIMGGANLDQADVSGALFDEVNLSDARFMEANLSSASLRHADVSGTDFRGAKLSAETDLIDLRLSSSTRFGDVRWNGARLLQIDWSQIRQGARLLLGDETLVDGQMDEKGKRRVPTRRERITCARDAARAYRGLGRELKDQNLAQEASWCRLSEQRMERRGLFVQRSPGAFLAGCGSSLLDLVSGYGEIPIRTFLSYVLVVLAFAGLDFFASQIQATQLQHLSWDEALVLSLTSFHGRGFFPGTLPLGDWAARLGAVEAVIGLFIELILIATFTRRFLGN